MEFERHIIKTAEEVATTFRAMAVCGPRQVGKTWLLKRLAAKLGGYETVSLDDEALLVQARNDPKLFLDLHPAPLVIDEIQSAPELFGKSAQVMVRMAEETVEGKSAYIRAFKAEDLDAFRAVQA